MFSALIALAVPSALWTLSIIKQSTIGNPLTFAPTALFESIECFLIDNPLFAGQELKEFLESYSQLVVRSRIPHLSLVPASEMSVDHAFGNFFERFDIGLPANEVNEHLHDARVLSDCFFNVLLT